MSNNPTTNKKSPLSSPPLRQAGQGSVERREALLAGKAMPVIFVAYFAVVLALLEWINYLSQRTPSPWLFTLLAAAAIVFAYAQMRKFIKEGQNLTLGLKGEQTVAEEIGDLVQDGAKVFHDLQGDGYNLDHVIISDRGVFTVETKTHSKPARGKASIHYDGERIWENGIESRGDILTQARAQQGWMRKKLKESTGLDFPVMAMVVFPGWYVEVTRRLRPESVCVLNPKMVRTCILNMPPILSPEEVQMAIFHTTQMIRSGERR